MTPPPKEKESTMSHTGITQVHGSQQKKKKNKEKQTLALLTEAHRAELELLLKGRKGRTKGKKAAIGRGRDFAGYSAHGTGCFITTFLTGFQIQPLLRILFAFTDYCPSVLRNIIGKTRL